MKIRISFLIGALSFVIALSAHAQATACDNQKKPTTNCPAGYSYMCVPVGGYHWACAKVVKAPAGSVRGTEVKLPSTFRSVPLPVTATARVVSTSSPRQASTTVNAISIAAREFNGWDTNSRVAFLQTVKAAAQIRSGQELENFARGVLIADPNVTQVAVNSESVAISYREPAKFLGIIKSALTLTVSASSEGAVTAQFPWYRFLFALPSEINADTIAREAESEIAASVTQNELQKRAAVLQIIANILKTRHDSAQ